MRDHRQEPGGTRHLYRLERLAESPDLIDLDENRIGNAALDAAGKPLRVRHEQIVADELATIAKRLRELRPPIPIILGQAVLDGDDRVLTQPLGVERDHSVDILLSTTTLLERVLAIGVQLARRAIQRQCDLFSG